MMIKVSRLIQIATVQVVGHDAHHRSIDVFAHDTFELLRERAPWCKVVVGGAVLTPEYAQMVGADFYAKDATETARIAGELFA